MKSFLYLVQGTAALVSGFIELRHRTRADALFLTYDHPLDGAIFFPNSSWAQGRNRLLAEAGAIGHEYLYYVFLDDDVVFDQGNWDVLERQLLRYRPAVAVPVNPHVRDLPLGLRLKHAYVAFVPRQPSPATDEQLIAVHRDVVADALVVPYQERFDHISWYWPARVQKVLIQTFYAPHVLLLNRIVVRNDLHREYPRRTADTELEAWLSRQFASSYRHPRRYPLLIRPPHEFEVLLKRPDRFLRANAWRAYWLARALAYRKRATYRLPPDAVSAALKQDADLFAQYRALRLRGAAW